MSSSVLQITIQALVAGLEELAQLRERLRETEAGAGDAEGELDALQTQAERAAQSFNTLVGYVKAAAAAFVAFAAVSSLKGAADLAARNETLGVTLGIVGKNAGYSSEQLSKYEQELLALGISTGSARDGMIQMTQAGLELGDATAGSTSNIGALARAAQDLAVVQGTSSSETFQGLIRNIQQLDTEGLRMQGIMVDLDQAYQTFATSLGKSTGSLSQQERQQAATNAVMEKAKALTGAYEAALDTVGKKLGSMSRYQEEASAAIGKSLLPAYKVLVDTASEFLKKVADTATAIAENGKVAEVLKNILQSVMTFAGDIASGVMKAVQSIAPALEDTFNKLDGAFESFNLDALTDTFSQVVEYATQFGVSVITAVGDATPSIRLLVDTFGMVASVIKSTVLEVMGFADGLEEGVSAGEVLSVILQTLGLLVAGFADGLSIVKAVAEIMFAGVMVGFGAISNAIGDIVGLVDENLGQAFKQAGDNAVAMGMKSAEAAVKTFKAFADGDTYLQKYADKLAKLPAAHAAEAKAATISADEKKAAFSAAEEMVRKYTEEVRKGKLTGQEAADEYKKTIDVLNAMALKYGFSEAELKKLSTQMDASKTKASDVSQAMKDLGLDAGEFATGVSKAASSAAAAFTKLATSGQVAADQLYEAFKKGLNMTSNISDLEKFKAALKDAFDSGKINAEQFGSSVQLLGGKFEELFQKQLKAASTKEDFRVLEEQVRKLGGGVDVTSKAYQGLADQLKNGTITSKEFETAVGKLGGTATISGGQMQAALRKIEEAASGAREKVQRLAEQTTELAQAATQLAEANLGVTRAAVEVQQAKNALVAAENNFKKEGTELAKQELEVAKLGVQLAQQKSQLAVLQRSQESAAYDVLIAKQQLLNAEKEAELKIGDEAAARKVESAKGEVESKTLVLETSKQVVEAQSQNVLKTEEAVVKARQLAENLRDAATAAASTASGAMDIDRTVRNTAGEMVMIATHTKESVANALMSAGLMSDQAKLMADSMLQSKQSIVAAGAAGVNAYAAINEKVKEVAATMQASGQAANAIRDGFSRVKAEAEAASLSAYGLGRATLQAGPGANLIAQAYREIALQAAQAAKSAEDATRGFLNSTRSIQEELLAAQGKDLQLSNSRFEARKVELQVQYELLKVQLEIARAQATAAGISTQGIDAAISRSREGYAEAKRNLAELQKMDEVRIQKAEAARRTEEVDKKKSLDLQLEKDKKAESASRRAAGPSMTPGDLAASVSRPAGADSSSMQSIAAAGGPPSFGGLGKTINVNLTAAGKTVSLQAPVGDEENLMAILSQLQKSAA